MVMLLLKVLVVALVCVAIYRLVFRSRAGGTIPANAAQSDRALAYIAGGNLFYRERGGQLQQLHSPYVDEALERRERLRERHGWKEGTSFNIAAGGGRRTYEAGGAQIPVTSAAYDGAGNLFYFILNETVGGLFRRDAEHGRELRVLLQQNLRLSDLTPAPDGASIAASMRVEGGQSNIVIMDKEGNNLKQVTGGDTVDSAPAWFPGNPKWMLFQSSGLARSAEGYVVAQGPASIQRLDMDKGDVVPIVEHEGFDHLKPRIASNGDLFYIRRPYQAPNYGSRALLLDTLMFPFRLLRALFHYLNFFSMMYSRKPLTSANGPAVQADIKEIMLQGRRMDAERALRGARTVAGVPSLVPDSWQLVRRNMEGELKVVATNVASYDLCSDGTILYSNGRGVFVLEQDGSPRIALTSDLVGEVMAAHA